MLGLFFISVLFQVFLPTANAVTLLRSPLTNDPNALCNDGSQAVYYHQQVGGDDGDGGGVSQAVYYHQHSTGQLLYTGLISDRMSIKRELSMSTIFATIYVNQN